MYTAPFPATAWLIGTIGMGAIAIGVLMMLAAGRDARSGVPEAVVRRDGRLGMRFILGGVAVLLGYAAWRLI